MKKVTKIEENKNPQAAGKKLRVAAYCRVSTGSDDAQAESLEAQINHYENYINSRSDWEYAGVYYDRRHYWHKKEKRPELKHYWRRCGSLRPGRGPRWACRLAGIWRPGAGQHQARVAPLLRACPGAAAVGGAAWAALPGRWLWRRSAECTQALHRAVAVLDVAWL